MSEIHAYRQIVELQVEIVRLSQKNAELESKCKQVQAQLILGHRKLGARKSARRAVLDFFNERNVFLRNTLLGLVRSAHIRPKLQRVWQSMV